MCDKFKAKRAKETGAHKGDSIFDRKIMIRALKQINR